MKKQIIGIIFGVLMSSVSAQRQSTDNLNAWFMYFGDHKVSDKWGVHLEAQFRRNNFFMDDQQLLLRTGINYHLSPQLMLTAGYCFVETYPYGGFPVKLTFPEHRLWEQVQIKTPLNAVEWVSRFRLEQRWSQNPIYNAGAYELGDATYTNRFRLLNRFSIPLKGKTIGDKSFYVSAYDEFFINFGEHVGINIFDQNRAYLALGYKIPKIGRLEIGYLNQLILKSDGIKEEFNHTFQVGLSSTIDFKKKKNDSKI